MRRLSSPERRRQIVDAALRLLADVPISQLSTRRVAKEVGVSQPALFRHFRSHDEILEAVVAHTRDQLEQLAEQVLSQLENPMEAVRLLLRGLFDHVAAHPGVPRLLFYDASTGEEGQFHQSIKHLLAMQKSLVSELLREGQRAGQVPPEVQPRRAAEFLIALIQGELLQWQLLGREIPLRDTADSIAAFWEAGLGAGEPRAAKLADAPPATTEASPPSRGEASSLLRIDVRPLLAAGEDPLETILGALENLNPDGLLRLTAPFRPMPLLALLGKRGYRIEIEQTDTSTWDLEVFGSDSPELADYRCLPVPEPMEQILLHVTKLAQGACFLARVPRVPKLLFPRLEERGLCWEVLEEEDGSAILHIRRPA